MIKMKYNVVSTVPPLSNSLKSTEMMIGFRRQNAQVNLLARTKNFADRKFKNMPMNCINQKRSHDGRRFNDLQLYPQAFVIISQQMEIPIMGLPIKMTTEATNRFISRQIVLLKHIINEIIAIKNERFRCRCKLKLNKIKPHRGSINFFLRLLAKIFSGKNSGTIQRQHPRNKALFSSTVKCKDQLQFAKVHQRWARIYAAL